MDQDEGLKGRGSKGGRGIEEFKPTTLGLPTGFTQNFGNAAEGATGAALGVIQGSVAEAVTATGVTSAKAQRIT